jgi:hypothetical protein
VKEWDEDEDEDGTSYSIIVKYECSGEIGQR